MRLPEIPDEAVEAAWYVTDLDRHDMPVVREALTAAWPHLYAAALRGAAEEWGTYASFHPYARGVRDTITDLRRMADEATP